MLGRRDERGLLGRAAGKARGVGGEPGAVVRSAPARALEPAQGAARDHHDAIHRTGRDAQLAPGTQLRDDGVSELLRADDGIDGAGGEAFDAADAARFVDLRDERRALDAVVRD